MPTFSVDGSDLYYERRGSGEPLLLVQGTTGHSLHWGEPFLTALERDFELVLYDHRGVGRSASHDGPFTIADLAGDADALLEGLGIERAHVLGISMGGMVAQELALGAPERVWTLTLGCTYCGGPGSRFTEDASSSGSRRRSCRATRSAASVPAGSSTSRRTTRPPTATSTASPRSPRSTRPGCR
jgi:pimeloyl-ACP methyl ester carboxylesterase